MGVTKDMDEILRLQFIPFSVFRKIPKDIRPGPMSQHQRQQVKAILRMRKDTPFNRCKGQSRKAIMDFEAAGDFSHSGWIPGTHGYRPRNETGGRKKNPECGFCEACRCGFKAGEATKGDFYGLGNETGTIGVGFCQRCIRSHRIDPIIALRIARSEVNAIQTYGSASTDTEYALKALSAETAVAEQRIQAREELVLISKVLSELTHELVEEKRPQQWVNQGKDVGATLEPVDDVTLHKMRLDAAKVLSKLRLDDLKLDRTKFIQVDHVIRASKAIEQAVRTAIAKTHELTAAKTVGDDIETDRPVIDYVFDMFSETWVKIWLDVKANAGVTR